MIYTFADCVLDMRLCVLHRAGKIVPLRPKMLQLLLYLLMHRDRVVTKEELCEQIWATPFVSDATVANCIKAIRQAAGDSGQAQRIIQTRRGHGYRFVATVTPLPVRSPLSQPALAPILSVGEVTQTVEPCTSLHGTALWWLPHATGERKVVTVLCCALVSPSLRAMHVHRDAEQHLYTLYAQIRRVAERYEGRLQPLREGCILVVFGIPVAQEDHACRAVFTALDLCQQVVALQAASELPHGETLPICMGLHTGVITLGSRGEGLEPTTGEDGHPASLAMSLQARATAGQILCSAVTAALIQQVVHLAAVPPLHVSAQATTVRAYQVVGRAPRHLAIGTQAIRGARPLVGRSRELAILQTLWTQVQAGQGQVVGLVGEPGMGKSRLVTAFCQQLHSTRYSTIAGRCLSYGRTIPYLPVLELLQHACGFTEADPPAIVVAKVHRRLRAIGLEPEAEAPYLLHLLGTPCRTDWLGTLSPEALKVRTFEVLRQVCINTSLQRPLLIVIEDLHWIDATSEAWIKSLIEHLVGAPILLLLTYRPGYSPPWMAKSYATQLVLAPLTSQDSQQVVRAVLPVSSVAEDLIHTIVAKAEGNPFFLEELCRSIIEQPENQATLVVPETIQAVLAARIDRLPAAAKHVLQAAAVIGTEVPVPLLQTIITLSESELLQSLLDLYAAEFLYETCVLPTRTARFTHVFTRDVAYQSLLPSTRQYYHQQIAHALTTLYDETVAAHPELVAHHYTEGGCHGLAIHYWHQAGQHAVERSAYTEAIAHLTRGLELLTTLPHTSERHHLELQMHTTLGPALMAVKGQRAPDVERIYTRARELCQQVGESQQLFTVLMGLWRFHIARKAFQTAREIAEQLLHLAHRLRDPAFLLEAHQAMGISCYFLRTFISAHYHLEQGIFMYNPQCHRAHAALYLDAGVMCRSYAALVLWVLGYLDQALARSHEALPLAHELAHPATLAYALMRAAEFHGYCREIQATYEQADTAITLVTQHGFAPWYLAPLYILRGWALAQRGQAEEGLAQIHEGLAVYRTAAREVVQPYHLAYLAEAYACSGQIQAGLDVLGEAFGATYSTGPRPDEAWLYYLRGELLIQTERRSHLREAEICLRRALAIAHHQHAKSWELRAAVSLSRLWRQQGKQAYAYHVLAEVYEWFREGLDTADLQEAKALLEELEG